MNCFTFFTALQARVRNVVNSSAIVSSSTASYSVPNSDCTLLLKAVLGQLSQRFALQVIFPTARTGTVEKVQIVHYPLLPFLPNMVKILFPQLRRKTWSLFYVFLLLIHNERKIL